MLAVIENITKLLQKALDDLVSRDIIPADAKFRIQIDRSKDKTHGDLATNVALMLAKACRCKPRDLAQQIIDALEPSVAVAKIEIAGPGFINFFLSHAALAAHVERALGDADLLVEKAQTAQTIVVDYSSPNLAKEMHVGHLRSTIIGDAVARTLAFLGHRVIRQNHVGDWGTQFGMLLAYLEEGKSGDVTIDMHLSDLEIFYRASKLRFDESEKFARRARALVVALQSGDAYCLHLWREFNAISLGHCQHLYDRLNVSLTPTDVRGESQYNDALPQVVTALRDGDLLTEDQGAQCVFLAAFKGKDGAPFPLIVQKKDGGYLYASTDLAAIRYRRDVLHADCVLYFVDARQSLHFQQVFAVARQAGFASEQMQLEHMSFGSVLGDDGKPFKTREGGVTKLADLLTQAEERAYHLVQTKNPDLDAQTLRKIAQVVGIAAVKYADLSKNRTSDYVFSWRQMLSFEGNTAPYLLYAYTRIMSIFRKSDKQAENLTAAVVLTQTQEVALAAKLAQLNDVVRQVAKRGMPHLLCAYLFELSSCFSTFYEACPVLQAGDDAVKQSRLKLALLTAKTLRLGLDLLGIKTLEKM